MPPPKRVAVSHFAQALTDEAHGGEVLHGQVRHYFEHHVIREEQLIVAAPHGGTTGTNRCACHFGALKKT